jgi:hypothetical protein
MKLNLMLSHEFSLSLYLITEVCNIAGLLILYYT